MLDQKQQHIMGGLQKKRPFFIVFYYEGVRTPPPLPFIVTWDSEIFGTYFNVVVDAIGPETDFTLESNVKKWEKNHWTLLWFHYLDHNLQTLQAIFEAVMTAVDMT